MLYTTTRNRNDVHTAYRAIHLDAAQDGGLFLPFSMPHVETGEISALKDRSFGENVAKILNTFFACGLTGYEVDLTIGRNAVRCTAINYRLVMAECWHNSHWRFAYIEQALSDRLRRENIGDKPGNWVRIAIRVAVLFGIYGIMLANQQVSERMPLDIAVTAADFSTAMACWYAREMGLPIGNIICGCNANGAVWEMLYRGQINPSVSAVATSVPEADIVLPADLERLIHGVCGEAEANRYADCCRDGVIYNVSELMQPQLRDGFFASVNSDSRVISLISNFYTTNHYVLSPYAALSYGSLTDYRAKTGESRTALVICEHSPVRDDAFVASAMDISVPELEKILNLA